MDVAVIGGGPSGLLAAREAARRGVDVAVFEEHSRIGVPIHCAGLLSTSGLRRLGLPHRGVYVQNRVRGALFYSPSGLSFTVERPHPVACVVDRALFDQELADRAADRGADIRLNMRVDRVKPLNGRAVIYGRGFKAEASV
ncbi:MAG TPA: NAD(P)/FAD-dependent oxidoreductase, partial [Candidatus Bathyarchaeota archaeon]|nr:NAD(P)/FAD-dependent oxidoreductase [Candidatus Bathyarchaeota archaeon]